MFVDGKKGKKTKTWLNINMESGIMATAAVQNLKYQKTVIIIRGIESPRGRLFISATEGGTRRRRLDPKVPEGASTS